MHLYIESLESRRFFSIVTYSNLDPGAGPDSPRPNSDAAAAQFDAAAAAIANVSIITFEGLPTGSFSSLTVAPGVVLTGVANAGGEQAIQNAVDFPGNVPLGGFNTTAGGSEYANLNAGTLTFTFASPVQFFGAYFSGVQSFFNDAIEFSDGSSQSVSIPTGTIAAGGLSFAGFTDAGSSITSVTIDAGTSSSGFDGFGMDDVRYQTTAPNKIAFAHAPTSVVTGAVLGPVTVDVEDSLGDVLTGDNSNVTIAITTGPAGAILNGTTTVAAVNGVATFSDLSLTTPGTYTATITDGAFTPAVAPSFTVYPPPKTIGTLDPTFGVGGLASHDVGFTSTDGTAQDGTQSIIIGTIGVSLNESFGVTRFNGDGSLDTSFGTSGTSSIFNSTDDVPAAVTVLPTGQILVAGTATTFTNGVSAGSEFVVAEYNADGSVDTSFGDGNGEVLISFASGATLSNDVLKAMVVNAAGVIYLGGSSDAGGTGGTDFAIAALGADGSVDAAAGGKMLQDFANGDDVINSLALQTSGDLIAAGSATVGGVTEIALARFLPTGGLDKRFGTKGLTTTNVRGVYDSASSVVIQPKGGQIVIGGLSATGSGVSLSSDFVVARYTSTGHLDRSFGRGPVITSFGQPSAITQLLLQSDGDIVASGKTISSLVSGVTPASLELAVARYTTRGVLDTTFNGTGKTIINLNSGGVTAADDSVITTLSIEPLDASSLGAEFAQFTASGQGAVSMTPGGEILDAGNSGTDTFEAELVTAGVDLASSLVATVPTAVTGGARGTASVAIAEDGTSQATGTVTIDLQAATDALGDGATTFKTIPEKINLKQMQKHSYRISFVYPENLTAGDYFLVAVVDDSSSAALADLNVQNNLASSKTAVNIAPAFIELVGANLTATSTLTTGKAAKVSFTLTNDGNVTARGATVVELIFSTDAATADGTVVDASRVAISLPATPKPHTYRLSFRLPAAITARSYYLFAVIDPLDSLGSIDKTSSTVVDSVLVTVKG